ncbi:MULTISPECIES: hypothetical protein [Methylomonas]|uniref:Uncharacterized protein n=1 Tax=Methylomonas koyamae TaxID=702114 RepID=A0A177NYR5_9GAMM|nr:MULTISPECIES: hypothetical protein [Methylomonas]NJA05876.1 hypothetical protein [Methylococcaceae bacterium WWC4]OAI22403.1 hypothetical protein A1355_01965 [Methylomonas koyamae]OHX34867.1 hypothetical protein BJL95_12395 [Methylomonas sp. LWB]
MTQLTTVSQSQNIQAPKKSKRPAKPESDFIELFPLPKYFQTHFQHIHENNQSLHQEIRALNRHLARLEAKMDLALQTGWETRCENCPKRN